MECKGAIGGMIEWFWGVVSRHLVVVFNISPGPYRYCVYAWSSFETRSVMTYSVSTQAV